MENHEFTVLLFAQLAEKLTWHLKLMYKHTLCPSQDPRKGYVTTFNNFFKFTPDEESNLMDGAVDIDSNGDFVAQQLCQQSANSFIFMCYDDTFPVNAGNGYISYCPSTFMCNNVQGTVIDKESGANGDPDTSDGNRDVVLEHIKHDNKDVTLGGVEEANASNTNDGATDSTILMANF
eukprot:12479552-Ditylum_brightwellii.AAC.1